MLALKFFLMILGLGLFGSAGIIVAYDVYVAARLRWLLEQSSGQGGAEGITLKPDRPFRPVRSKLAGALALAGILPALLALSISVVPDGYAGIRVSQISGVHPATLYPGAHFQTPFIDTIVLYDTREQVYTTSAVSGPKTTGEVLSVQAREGLNIGLAVSVRYRLDPTRLGSIHQNLPQPVGDQVVAPVVSSIYRQLAPNYETREIFAVKREELRTHAAEAIKTRLASDGIVVREVLLRDIQLPAEYAKGLEGLLLKEQENDRLGTEQEIKQKEVRIAELEAQKARDVKRAEAQAQVRVLQAKAEADAMQYTLPLKQKQIEQSKLEAEARKEATLQNAEAAAQAKIIDSKAEVERQKNLADAEANRIRVTADAEANRIRVTAAADAERLKFEAAVLKQNPMLIQKIIAERLSDKLQIMMVPVDGKNFFANDVFRSAFNGVPVGGGSGDEDAERNGPATGNLSAQKRNGRKP